MTQRSLGSTVLLMAGIALLVRPALHLATRMRSQAVTASSVATRTRAPSPGDVWGRIQLPRVGLDLVVYEGVSAAALGKGPGHVPGTACSEGPGEPGNCVIAGHRDTFFRRLAHARAGDLVRLSGDDGAVATYRLDSRRIVRPEEVSVLFPSRDRRLTLITCYPFSWLGPAPYRLVWTAAAVDPIAQK